MLQRTRALACLTAVVLAVVVLPQAVSGAAAPPLTGRMPGGVDDMPSTVTAVVTSASAAASIVLVDPVHKATFFVAGAGASNNVGVFLGYYTNPATGAVISGPYKYIRDESGTPITPIAQPGGCVQALTMRDGVSVSVPNQVACPPDFGATILLGDGDNAGTATTGTDCIKRRRKKCVSTAAADLRVIATQVPPTESAPTAAVTAADLAETESVATPQFIDFGACLFGCGDGGGFNPDNFDWWGGGGGSGGHSQLDQWIRNPPRPPPPLPPDSYNVFDKFFGGDRAERFNCVSGGCWVAGGGGDDHIKPSETGNDLIAGGWGNDTIIQPWVSIPDQFDIVDGEEGNDVIDSPGVGISYGGAGDDQIWSSGTMFGNAGNDDLHAVDRGDRINLVGGQGADELFGDSSGHKTVADYYDSTGPVWAAIGGAAGGGTATGDVLDGNIWGIEGSPYADALAGNWRDNYLSGDGGDDTVSGGDGKDHVRGGNGADTLNGDGGGDVLKGEGDADKLNGGSGDDKSVAGAGNDLLTGGSGADMFNCGAGSDTVSYAGSPSGVNVTIGGRASGNSGGDAAGDSVNTNCDALFGSNWGDKLTGDQRSNSLFGNGGDDEIGAYRNSYTFDTIDCGTGNDKATVDNAGWSSCETIIASEYSNQTILGAIRARESGGGNPIGDYKAESPWSSASGAYQFIDQTWQSLLGPNHMNNAGWLRLYKHAADAPPSVQDAVADWYVKDILRRRGNDLGKLALEWYDWNCAQIPGNIDKDPVPGDGVNLTCRQYRDKWMVDYQNTAKGGMPAR